MTMTDYTLDESFELAKYPDLTLLTPEEERANRRERIKQVVLNQKEAVRKQLHSRGSGSSSEANVELSGAELIPIVESANSVFPKWMHRHPDFQRAFPRFAKERTDEIALVEVVMSKKPEQRCREDVRNLIRYLQKYPALQDHRELSSPQALAHVSKVVTFWEYKKGHQICLQKQQASSFYIVLRGEVMLTSTNSDPSLWDQVVQFAPGSDRDHLQTPDSVSSQDLNHSEEESGKSPDHLRHKSPNVATVRRIKVGPYSCFGATALSASIGDEQQFGATVCSTDTCAVLRIRAHEFRDALKNFRDSQNSTLVRFLLEDVNLFKHWSKHRVNQLTPYLTTKHVKAGDIIQLSGVPMEQVYFIRRGTCEVVREIAYRQYNQWPESRTTQYKVLEFEVTKPMKVATLQPGEYVGGEFFFPERSKGLGSQCTVCAVDDVELCVLGNRHAKKLFGNRTIEMMREALRKLDCSEDELRANYVAEVRLNKKYQRIRNSTIGPKFTARMTKSRQSIRLQKSGTCVKKKTSVTTTGTYSNSNGQMLRNSTPTVTREYRQSYPKQSGKKENQQQLQVPRERHQTKNVAENEKSLPSLNGSTSTSSFARGKVRTRVKRRTRVSVDFKNDRRIVFEEEATE